MRYILIANNEEFFDDKNFDDFSISLSSDDTVLLFNRLIPIKWPEIAKHKNKIFFIRNFIWWLQRQGNNRAEIFKKYHHLFKEIYLVTGDAFPHEPLRKKSSEENDIEKYFVNFDFNFSTLKVIEEEINQLEDLNIPSGKIPTTGFLVYLYVKNYLLKENDEIILLGFSGKGIWNGHDSEYEQNYYMTELKTQKLTIINEEGIHRMG